MTYEPDKTASEAGRDSIEKGGASLHQVEEYRRKLSDAAQELAEYEDVVKRLNKSALQAELLEIELHQIFNATGDGMWVVDQEQRVHRINEEMLRLLGKKRNEALNRKCCDLLTTSLCGTSDCPMSLLKNGEKRIECDIKRVNRETGKAHHFILTASAFSGLDGLLVGIVSRFKDITSRKKAEKAIQTLNEKLALQVKIDGLTQVANRRHLDEVLDREWKRHKRERQPLAIIICDIDHFKQYNDHYGHQQGDDCLRKVARAIEKILRRPADFVGRYGGEEFVVILPKTHSKGLKHVAEKIRTTVKDLKIPHEKSQTCRYVSISLGSACAVPKNGNEAGVLVERADQALYKAKKQGRNRVVHWDQSKSSPSSPARIKI